MLPARAEVWLSRPRDAAAGASCATLVCFPHAGAGASVFQPWRALVSPGLEVAPVLLPGREQRLDEAPVDDLDSLVATLAEVIAATVDPPFSFFGHSFGALLAFEIARELRRRDLPLPDCLFASGRPAPDVCHSAPDLHGLPDDLFVSTVSRRYGGIPEVILAEPDLLALFLPALRADLKMSELYRYRSQPPLPFPIVALGGRSDSLVAAVDLERWAAETVSPAPVEWLDGGHFFVQSAREAVVEVVSRVLRERGYFQGRRP